MSELTNYKLVSNHMGPDGESIDRIYGSPASGGHMTLMNRDYTPYKGNIHKRAITCKGIAGEKFRSHVYVTDDNRWFDRCGLPIEKPTNLVSEKHNEVLDQ